MIWCMLNHDCQHSENKMIFLPILDATISRAITLNRHCLQQNLKKNTLSIKLGGKNLHHGN